MDCDISQNLYIYIYIVDLNRISFDHCGVDSLSAIRLSRG